MSEYNRPELKLGLVIGQTTVVGIHAKTYTAQCSCGVKMNRKLGALHRPTMCKHCTKGDFSEGDRPVSEPTGIYFGENTKMENLMIKKFKGTLTDKEAKKLKKHIKKVKNG